MGVVAIYRLVCLGVVVWGLALCAWGRARRDCRRAEGGLLLVVYAVGALTSPLTTLPALPLLVWRWFERP